MLWGDRNVAFVRTHCTKDLNWVPFTAKLYLSKVQMFRIQQGPIIKFSGLGPGCQYYLLESFPHKPPVITPRVWPEVEGQVSGDVLHRALANHPQPGP